MPTYKESLLYFLTKAYITRMEQLNHGRMVGTITELQYQMYADNAYHNYMLEIKKVMEE